MNFDGKVGFCDEILRLEPIGIYIVNIVGERCKNLLPFTVVSVEFQWP